MTNFDFLLSSPDFASFGEAAKSKLIHPAKPEKTGNPETILDAAILRIKKEERTMGTRVYKKETKEKSLVYEYIEPIIPHTLEWEKIIHTENQEDTQK